MSRRTQSWYCASRRVRNKVIFYIFFEMILSTHTYGHTTQLFASVWAVNLYTPRGQNFIHFADDIFMWILLNEKFCISIQISLKFVPNGPIDNESALFQVMAWCRTGNKPLPETTRTQCTDAHIRGTRGRGLMSMNIIVYHDPHIPLGTDANDRYLRHWLRNECVKCPSPSWFSSCIWWK